jgi:peptidoglycan/LPS O-acetylase OafA/YrhL
LKLDQLTFTRFLAALSVVFFHYGEKVFPASIDWINPVVTAGPIAVSYFFVLSGFIMAIAYYKPNNPSLGFSSTRYWLARFARIYPVYFLALLMMILAKKQGQGSDITAIGLSVSMLQAWIPSYPLMLNAPGWSLSVEAFFYLLFPLLIFWVKQDSLKNLVMVSSILWIATQFLHMLLLNSPDYEPFSKLHDVIFYNPLLHLSTFLIGLSAGVALKQGKLNYWAETSVNNKALLISLAMIVLLLIIREPFIHLTSWRVDYTNGLIAPLFLTFIVLLSLNKSSLTQHLQHKGLLLLGEASFSLYILQKPVHGIYEKMVGHWLNIDSDIYFYGFVIVLTLLAVISFKYFETPLRHFINTWHTSSDKDRLEKTRTAN